MAARSIRTLRRALLLGATSDSAGVVETTRERHSRPVAESADTEDMANRSRPLRVRLSAYVAGAAATVGSQSTRALSRGSGAALGAF
jgi:hypothetical protein